MKILRHLASRMRHIQQNAHIPDAANNYGAEPERNSKAEFESPCVILKLNMQQRNKALD